jgi:hypothetical protein
MTVKQDTPILATTEAQRRAVIIMGGTAHDARLPTSANIPDGARNIVTHCRTPGTGDGRLPRQLTNKYTEAPRLRDRR